MQGSIEQNSKKRFIKFNKTDSKLLALICFVAISVFIFAVVVFNRIEHLQQKNQTVSEIYLPMSKQLNLISGKWQAYLRNFEQVVSFKNLGTQKNQNNYDQKFKLKKQIDQNINEIQRLLIKNQNNSIEYKIDQNLYEQINSWTNQFINYAEREYSTASELILLTKTKNYSEAAGAYTWLKQSQIELSQVLQSISNEVENITNQEQLSFDQEMKTLQTLILSVLFASLLVSVIVVFQVRRWFMPINDWINIAKKIAINGVQTGLKFPEPTRSTPNELNILSSEFSRMSFTILEREKTVQQQSEKLKFLNQRLKDQNERLVSLGSLNEKILNNMTAGLVVISESGAVEQFNSVFCEMFSLDKSNIFKENIFTLLKDSLNEELKNIIQSNSFQHISKYKNNKKYFDIKVQPFTSFGSDKRMILFEDISDIVYAREKWEHAQKLILASDMSSQFAHEIRNPLNSMNLQLEMLIDDLNENSNGPELNKKYIDRIYRTQEQIERLDRLTQNYLNMKKEGMKLKTKVSLNDIIEKSLENYSNIFIKFKISIEYNHTNEDIYINADTDSITQVVFNLLNNSIDALNEINRENKKIIIDLYSKNGTAFITVSDNGSGLSNSIKEKLFEPFVTSKVEGHGLGLSISKQICHDHAGNLEYEHNKDFTKFKISIPTYQERL